MPSLIARWLWAAHEENPAEIKVPPDAGARRPSVTPVAGTSGQSQSSEAEPVMVCFSCGRPGHGVNRCSRVDTSFPFLPRAGTGQYGLVDPWRGFLREMRDGPGGRVSLPDHRGMTDHDGGGRAAPVARSQRTWGPPGRQMHGSGWSSSMQAFRPAVPPERYNRRMPALAQPVLGQRDRVVPDSPIRMGGSLPSLVAPVSGARRPGRGMWPAGWTGRSVKTLSGDYADTDNGMVSDGKTFEILKMD